MPAVVLAASTADPKPALAASLTVPRFRLRVSDVDSEGTAADLAKGARWTLTMSTASGARLRLTRPQGYIHDPAGKQCFSGSAVEEDLGCLQYAHSFADSSSARAADGANDPFSSAHGGSELVSITGSLALLNKACSWVYYEPHLSRGYP